MKVAVVKCSSYDQKEVDEAVKKAVGLIGGIALKPYSKVLIKPNVLGYHKPEEMITTHPAIIEAICKLLPKHHITIGDSCGTGIIEGTKRCLEITGIKKAGEKYNAKVIAFEEGKIRNVVNSNFKILKEIPISEIALTADFIINAPKLKTHSLTLYTGAVKNMFGCVIGNNKLKCHNLAPKNEQFSNLLLDVYQNVKPNLTIMDAVYGIEGLGPATGGKIKKVGLILASYNAAALDIVASEIIGYAQDEVLTNKYAKERGFVKDEIEVIGEKNVKIDFKKPPHISTVVPEFIVKIYSNLALMYPHVIDSKCNICKNCIRACPTGAMSIKNKFPEVDKKRCISCFCCHEQCPHNAIELKASFIVKVWQKLKEIINFK